MHDIEVFLLDQTDDYIPPLDILDGRLEEHDPRPNFTLVPTVEGVSGPLSVT